jgi:two-component system, LytTR family, response regulator
MERIRVLIVDDEVLARRGIRMELEREAGVEVIGECIDGRQAVTAIRELEPDLVFLDQQMPKLDGFGVISAIGPESMPAVIFVTAYDQYALQAFEIHAVDYLLKPFSTERFKRAFDHALLQIKRANLDDLGHRLTALLGDIPRAPVRQQYLTRVVVRSGDHIQVLKAEEIDWIESADNYVQIHVGREAHLLRETLSHLEERLDPGVFLRVHRRTIVNVNRIKELHPLFHGTYEVVLQGGGRLTSGRLYRKNIQALLDNSL